MKIKCNAFLSVFLFAVLTLPVPATAALRQLIVEHNASGTDHFETIQRAIESAHTALINPSNADNFEIKVMASSTAYTGPITLKDPIAIFGERTDGTFILGGTDTLVTATGIKGGEFRNFTFLSAGTAISISGDSSLSVTNNVFVVGTDNTAIQVTDSPSAIVKNNTFHRNKVAISTNSDIVIINNIFSLNGTAIFASSTTQKASYNDYFPNPANRVPTFNDFSIPNPNQANPDPKFVDPDNGDFTKRNFHLQSGSPCIGTGNPQEKNPSENVSDMGAFGGPKRDIPATPAPATVTGVATTLTLGATSSSIAVSWDPSTSPNVTEYRVYYRSSDGTTADQGSPVKVPFGTNSTTLTGLPLGPTAPSGTQPIVTLIAQNQALLVSWPQISNATGYRVSYGTSASDLSTTIPVEGGSSLSTTISGLTNGTTYFVAVTPIAETKITVSVTAVLDASLASNPGSANESAQSEEKIEQIGTTLVGTTSETAHDFPEATTAFPNLKGEGCFIATAAFGFYSAPQVQALRDFRDRFLLTNAPGRAFVAWYYHYGPKAAHFINEHPWLKAPVRVALFPLIVMALVLNGGSPAATTGLILLAMLWCGLHWRRRQSPHIEATALKNLLLAVCLILLPGIAQGAEARPDRPHWSLELKAGAFFPQTANWSRYFDASYTGEYGGALAYKVHRLVEIGVEGSYLRASGKGQLPQHGTVSSQEATYELAPLNVFILGRALFSEDQLLVPYAGAGYTRLFYRQDVKGQGTTKGSVNGFHARGGVQILMDGLEPDASHSLYQDYGIHHTYLFVEGKYLDARADTVSSGSVNLGGTSVLGGFLFEF